MLGSKGGPNDVIDGLDVCCSYRTGSASRDNRLSDCVICARTNVDRRKIKSRINIVLFKVFPLVLILPAEICYSYLNCGHTQNLVE